MGVLRKILLPALIVSGALGVRAEARAAVPALELLGETTVNANVVQLGDIVVSCPPALVGVTVMSSPGYGGEAVVSRATLASRLYQASRIRARFSGAKAVRIRRAGFNRGPEIQQRVLKATRQATKATPGVDFEIEFPSRRVMLPPGRLSVSCRMPDSFEGHRVIRADVRVGEARRSVNLTARFNRTLRVPVATRRLVRGDTLLAGDVRYEERTFPSRVPQLIPGKLPTGQFRVLRTVNEGTLLTERVVQRQPAVSTGQVVDLVVEHRGVKLTARARALQTGWVGSRIRVQNLVDRSFLRARVIAKGVVKYE